MKTLSLIHEKIKKLSFPKKLLQYISLDENLIIGYGTKRICYLHPADESKVIKVAKFQDKWILCHQQSLAEWKVFSHLSKKGKHFKFISYCTDWVATNKGPGIIFERPITSNGTSTTLRSYIFQKKTSPAEAKQKIVNFTVHAANLGIPISDFNIDNFVIENSDTSYSLTMVDGVGARKPGLKLSTMLLFPCYARYRTKKQFLKQKKHIFQCVNEVYAGDINFKSAQPICKPISENSLGS